MGSTVKRVLRRGSEKGISRRCQERPLEEYAPLGRAPHTREQKRHIKLLHLKLLPVAPVAGPPGRVSGQKDLCSLGSEDSIKL